MLDFADESSTDVASRDFAEGETFCQPRLAHAQGLHVYSGCALAPFHQSRIVLPAIC